MTVLDVEEEKSMKGRDLSEVDESNIDDAGDKSSSVLDFNERARRLRHTKNLSLVACESEHDPFVATPQTAQPPRHLRARAEPGGDDQNYLRVGHRIAQATIALMRSRAIAMKGDARVLDFGCGCGRVATWLHALQPEWQLTGTDIDAEAMGWSQTNLKSTASFDCNHLLPPLSYWDNTFNLVVAFDVLDTPDDENQSSWLEELVRVTKPGGYLLISTAANVARPLGSFHESRQSPGVARNLSALYRTPHHSVEVIRQAWNDRVSIEQVIPRWLGQRASLVICRK